MSSLRETKKLVAVVQLNCNENKEGNLSAAEKLVEEAKSIGCSMAFLPECFDFIGTSKKEMLENLEPIDGPLIKRYSDLAKRLDIWLSLGGLHEKNPENEGGKANISHLIIDNTGRTVSVYRKAHLFNLDIPGSVRLVESEFSVAGKKIIPPVKTPVGRVGQGICYDLRFPEFAISLAKSGADILTYPSSFTVPTGSAHWEPLLRSRAIENQCYVIAAGQVGQHNPKRASWGHSMIIDPWGSIVAQCSDSVGLAVGFIDTKVLQTARSRLPVWTDRRNDLYGSILPIFESNEIDSQDIYKFGEARVKSSQVYAKTNSSFAFLSHRPFLPGHSLVAPLRETALRMADLTPQELSDLFSLVQKAEKALEEDFGCNSSTVVIQDGDEAGRTINHLHVHVLPRKKEDINSDLIYIELQKSEQKDDRKLLTQQQMKETASKLRKYFVN